MGLDISHFKATLKKPKTSSPFVLSAELEKDFEAFNVPFEHFDRYIKDVEVHEPLNKLILIKDPDQAGAIRKRFPAADTDFLELEPGIELQKQLSGFEAKNNLRKLKKYIKDDKEELPWRVVIYYHTTLEKGFYYDDVGYQRKGVNQNFWYRFGKHEVYNYALWEDFEYAYSCIENIYGPYTEGEIEFFRKNFRENFLETFEEGASYLSLSY